MENKKGPEQSEDQKIVCLDVLVKNPDDQVRELHGDIRPSGNVRFRGANENNRWSFFSPAGDGYRKHDLSIRACIDRCVYLRDGVDLNPREFEAREGDELWAISSNGSRYLVGTILKVLPIAQLSELGDYTDGEFGNEPINPT